jgi:hypothetical protein
MDKEKLAESLEQAKKDAAKMQQEKFGHLAPEDKKKK